MEKAKESALKKEKTSDNILIEILYLLTSIVFTIPSFEYLKTHKSIYYFIYVFSYMYKDIEQRYELYINAIIYVVLFSILFLLYFKILKNINKIFKTNKSMFLYIIIIAVLFAIIIPTTSLDVYSYIGNGWVDSKYNENPYYTSVQDIWNKNGPDEMLGKVARCWRNEPVVYGPVWSVICKILTSFSFGNITASLYIFKIITLLVFLASTYLIYKITNKKMFTAMFALNPFILFEFLSNVHNDIFLVFFVLLGIYFLKNKKNIFLSVACIALATGVKYLSILMLPFILIYGLKDKKIKNKIGKSVLYVTEFILILLAFYLLYVKDIRVLSGIFVQQNKYSRSIFLGLYYLLNGDTKVLSLIKAISLGIFAVSYVIIILKLFFNENSKIKFSKLMKTYQVFLLVFTFLLITNFNSWYVIWLFPTLFYQKSKNIRYTLYLSMGVIYSYAITYSTRIDDETVGIPYFLVMVFTVVLLELMRNIKRKGLTNKGD